ncbi:MAG: hypothetical protein NC301_01620 [Bacteroides sp.]|nr:hypothetical protein [Bacteroides sp.]MCM1378582.1 hypothetical protein [Bacteroides sp.]MCM1444883.1 hypothetical protein [Prevotella sp.]
MKCLLSPLASAMLLVGLSACDEGRITETTTVVEPVVASERLTMEQKVQKRIFEAHCVQCHGGRETAAAGLFLTEGHESLSNRESNVAEGEVVVIPGNHSESLIYKAVATDISNSWAVPHNNFLDESEKYLLATWIDLQ